MRGERNVLRSARQILAYVRRKLLVYAVARSIVRHHLIYIVAVGRRSVGPRYALALRCLGRSVHELVVAVDLGACKRRELRTEIIHARCCPRELCRESTLCIGYSLERARIRRCAVCHILIRNAHAEQLHLVVDELLLYLCTRLRIKLHEISVAVRRLRHPPQAVRRLVELHRLTEVAEIDVRIAQVAVLAGLCGLVDAADVYLAKIALHAALAHGVETTVVGGERVEEHLVDGSHESYVERLAVNLVNVRLVGTGVVVQTEDAVCLRVVRHLVEDERCLGRRVHNLAFGGILARVHVHHTDGARHERIGV